MVWITGWTVWPYAAGKLPGVMPGRKRLWNIALADGRETISPVPWEALRQRVETVTSIHLTVQGSNLAHTCFTPEHVLTTGKGQWGLVGWQVAPRPYNYMRYRYLAWCLIHTPRGEVEKRYREHLQSMPTIHNSAANSLTFALSLLETWVNTTTGIELRAEKLQTVSKFIDEALEMAVEDKAEPWKN